MTLLAALDRNFAIGHEGDMPWHLPDDLKRFKQLTLGKSVLMGRKTALSIGRALPGRTNLVMSRSGSAPYADQIAVASLDEALRQAGNDELIVIGGGEIYALALPRAQRMHLTWIDTVTPSADTYFPRFDESDWRIVNDGSHPIDAKHTHAFRFVDYRRRVDGSAESPKA
ncbi:MAG: dihydrofolate reductase [Xanthomonadales bacterium]|nr:dihydrofolate reductase [Xanthomonadales bacterium]